MPKNKLVFDEVPKNRLVFDEKPSLTNIVGERPRSFNVVLGAGQWTGFLLSLTYPTAGTVEQWSETG